MREKIGRVLILIICAQLLLLSIMSLFIDFNWDIAYLFYTPIYVVIALVILLERKNFRGYNLDQIALFVLIFSSIFRRRLGVENELFHLLIIGSAGLVILACTILNLRQIPKTNFRWLIIGLLVGCIILIPITLIESFQPSRMVDQGLETLGPFWGTIRRLIYHLSFSAPIEEILFRSLLWGYLRKLSWSENKIFWFQGTLFWLSHLGAIGSPLTFFLSIPILTYITSELTKRSRQVSPSIFFHLIVNTMISVI